MDDVHAGADTRAARPITSAMAAVSAAGGPAVEPGAVAPWIAAGLAQRCRPAPHARAAAGRAGRPPASPGADPTSLTCANSVNARRAEKALEAADAGVRQRLEIGGVARDDTAPESDVHMALACGGLSLRLERRHGRRRRNAVERHVDERRDPAGGRRARRRLEAFPVSAARLVDVHVRIDEAGQDDVKSPRVDQSPAPGRCAGARARHRIGARCFPSCDVRAWPARDAVRQHDAPAR